MPRSPKTFAIRFALGLVLLITMGTVTTVFAQFNWATFHESALSPSCAIARDKSSHSVVIVFLEHPISKTVASVLPQRIGMGSGAHSDVLKIAQSQSTDDCELVVCPCSSGSSCHRHGHGRHVALAAAGLSAVVDCRRESLGSPAPSLIAGLNPAPERKPPKA